MERTQHVKKQFIAIALIIAMVCTLFTVPNSIYAETDDDIITSVQEKIVAEATSGNTYNAGTSECLKWVKSVYSACNFSYESASKGANDYGRAYYQYKTSTASKGDDIEDTIQPGMFVAVEYTNTTAGQKYGHIGIYIGDGYVVHWIGSSIQTISLSGWMSTYYTGYKYGTNYLYWGYPDDVEEAVEDELLHNLATATITLSKSSYTYTGSACTPTVTVKNSEGTKLTKSTDYTVEYSNNTDVGTAVVTITGAGDYTGTVEKTFTINAASVSSASVTLASSYYAYTGSEIEAVVSKVKVSNKVLTEGTDYTVSYSNNENVGTATVTITGTGNYTGTKTKTFTITKNNMAAATVTLSSYTYTYSGSARKPSVTVAMDDTTLKKNTDYTVSYYNNTEIGTATVMITGLGNYTGTQSVYFEICEGKAISDANVSLFSTSYTYDGYAKTPGVTVTYNGETLTKNTDYTVSYTDNIEVGTATVTISGKGLYTGFTTATFTIKEATSSTKYLLVVGYDCGDGTIEPYDNTSYYFYKNGIVYYANYQNKGNYNLSQISDYLSGVSWETKRTLCASSTGLTLSQFLSTIPDSAYRSYKMWALDGFAN